MNNVGDENLEYVSGGTAIPADIASPYWALEDKILEMYQKGENIVEFMDGNTEAWDIIAKIEAFRNEHKGALYNNKIIPAIESYTCGISYDTFAEHLYD